MRGNLLTFDLSIKDYARSACCFNAKHSHCCVSLPCDSAPPQAARVTDACEKVKGMGPDLRARPQLYASTPQLELDSYVTLTHAVKLRVSGLVKGRHVCVHLVRGPQYCRHG